jgi:hypothetical protein
MAITLMDGATTVNSNGTSTAFTVTMGSAPVQGSFLAATIAAVGGSNRTFTPPGGSWTLLQRQDYLTEAALAVYYKIAGPSETASYTFTFDSAVAGVVVIAAYSGVDPTAPVDGVSGRTNIATTSIKFNAVATTATQGTIFKVMASYNASSLAALADPGTDGTLVAEDGNSPPSPFITGDFIRGADFSAAGSFGIGTAAIDTVSDGAAIAFAVQGFVEHNPIAWVSV